MDVTVGWKALVELTDQKLLAAVAKNASGEVYRVAADV